MPFRAKWTFRKGAKLSHLNALNRLKSLGFSPKTVYDIGAYRGGWARLAGEVFPHAEIVLFEANHDNEPELRNSGRPHFIVALAGEDGAGKLFYLPRQGDVTGASLYRENTPHYANANLDVRKVATARLDTLIAAHGLDAPDLIKIDVQGAELDVLAGASRALAHCSALTVELSFVSYNKGAPLIADAMHAIQRQNFQCVDVCELHRTDKGFMLQTDLMFVKAPLFEKYCSQAGLT